MNFEILVLSFIRSLRESDFELCKETLSSLNPCVFGLDHVNYSRWLLIHLRDMVSLESKNPSIYREFAKSNFTIRKSTRMFSNMAIDQAHEQSNAVVKGDGGAIGLTRRPGCSEKMDGSRSRNKQISSRGGSRISS